MLSFKIAYNDLSTRSNFKGAISFGKEVIGSYARGFTLDGWIHPVVLKRMQGLYSSGILGWHDQFRKKYNQTSGFKPQRKY